MSLRMNVRITQIINKNNYSQPTQKCVQMHLICLKARYSCSGGEICSL